MARATIYTTAYCPFCFAAKRLLETEGIDFDEVRLDGDPELRHRVSAENGGWKTVPMVFLDGEFVGGHAELSAMKAEGRLRSCPSTT
jgi:glutaredoxin 3